MKKKLFILTALVLACALPLLSSTGEAFYWWNSQMDAESELGGLPTTGSYNALVLVKLSQTTHVLRIQP